MDAEDSDIGRPRDVVEAGCLWGRCIECAARKRRHGSASDRRDTPPVDVFFGVAAGLLARRSTSPPVFPMRSRISDVKREQLTAYSCGGSAGISRKHAIHPLPS